MQQSDKAVSLAQLREKVGGIADDVIRAPILRIIERVSSLWTNALVGVFTNGQLHNPDDPTYLWMLGPTKDHCSDCGGLAGQTKTASEWARAGIRPQSPDLECGGWNCLCQLVEVDRI